MKYYRPITLSKNDAGATGLALAGGSIFFNQCEVLCRDEKPVTIAVSDVPQNIIDTLTAKRSDIAGLSMAWPKIMGVLNTTPDSFSDGGLYDAKDAALERGREMIAQGADIIDIGGESTRPGADFVDRIEELARVQPVVETLSGETVVSIDTRKSDVAAASIHAGAQIFNDVTALSFDPRSLPMVAKEKPFVCLMHASGDPKTMQDDPEYGNVLLDIYDYLEARINACVAAGLPKSHIVVDPGIGFGKTLEHNLLLIQGLSLFHGLGCPILLGVSRKRFIGSISGAQNPAERMAGSLAVALEGLRQGTQILRVHDVYETVQATRLWVAMQTGEFNGA